jgi:SAM-dependent methyltransferase
MTAAGEASYFVNHDRRQRWPWSLYHRALERPIAEEIARHGASPRVLMVGCGTETSIAGARGWPQFFGCDLDPRAVETCRQREPANASRFAVCPAPYALPSGGAFDVPFDVVLAKEVIEHVLEPDRWARALSSRLVAGGALVLTTPNYGWTSTLPLIERTVLEWFARRDGYSRAHIHPTKFDRRSFARLDVGDDMRLVSVQKAPVTAWSLIGIWHRER